MAGDQCNSIPVKQVQHIAGQPNIECMNTHTHTHTHTYKNVLSVNFQQVYWQQYSWLALNFTQLAETGIQVSCTIYEIYYTQGGSQGNTAFNLPHAVI